MNTTGSTDQPRPLILIGGGGHCKSVIEAALSSGRAIEGILDVAERVGDDCLGVKVIGTDDDIARYAAGCDFVVTVGLIKDSSTRRRIRDLLRDCGGRLAPPVIASTACVSRFARIGHGTVVLHHASVNAGAEIGPGCIINTGAIVEHDACVERECHVSTGAIVNGACRIGERSFIGSGAVIANCLTISPRSIIGAGAVVVKDITAGGTYAGIPAKPLNDE